MPRSEPSRRQDRNRQDASDEALIGWAADGDRLAFDTLTLRHLPRLYSTVFRIIQNRAVAEETTQETMIRAWQNAARFDPDKARFATWLNRIGVNLALNHIRRPATAALADAPEQPDPQPGPEDTLLANERRSRLARALRELPARQRAALALFYDQELDGADAAAALSVSRRSLEGLLRRARQFLGTRLRDGEG